MKSKTTFSINQSSMAFLIGMLLCISSVSITVSAQNMQDTIIAHFNLLEKVPQEKLYLHLDKPFYGAGEKIWFKGYLVNAVTHQDNTQSNFIITELVNRSDSIIERRKIRRDSLGFHNALSLPPTLPAGDYYLRGYSNWMLNQEAEFFYSHNLKIGNSIDNTIVSTIEYQQEENKIYQQYSGNVQQYNDSLPLYRKWQSGRQRKKEDRRKWSYFYFPAGFETCRHPTDHSRI